jgi:hypothetical protein
MLFILMRNVVEDSTVDEDYIMVAPMDKQKVASMFEKKDDCLELLSLFGEDE